MGLELAKAFVRVRADASKLKGDLSGARAPVNAFVSSVQGSITGILSGLGVVGLGGVFLAAGREAAGFEDVMIKVRANARLLGKDGTEAFKRLERAARDMGATTRFSSLEAANALNQLVLGGLAAKDAIGALPSVLNLAASSGLGLAESAKIIVDNMVKYGLVAEDTGRIADFLSSAQSRAQITAAELAVAHLSLGSIAAEMGASFLDVTTILTAMGKSGTEMTTAGTALAMALARMTNQGGPATDVLRKMNIEIGDFTKPGGGIDLIPLFRAIADAMPDDPIKRGAKAIELFGIKGKAMLGIFGLMRRGRFVEETAKGLEKDIGRAAKVAAARMNTFVGILLKLKSALGEFAIAAVTPVLKAIEPLVSFVGFLAANMATVSDILVDLNKRMGGFTGNVIKATVGTMALVRAITLIGPAARVAGFLVRMALVKTGIGILVVAIGTAVGAIITFINWLKNTKAVQDALAANADKFRMAWERVKQAFELIVDAISFGLNMIMAWIEEWTGISIPTIANSIEGMAAQAIGFIADFVLDAAEWFLAFAQNWQKVVMVIPSLLKLALSFALDIFLNWIDFQIKNVFLLIKVITRAFASIPGLIVEAFTEGGDVGFLIAKQFNQAMAEFQQNFQGIFEPSERTKKILKDDILGVFADIALDKAALERGRGDLLAGLGVGEDGGGGPGGGGPGGGGRGRRSLLEAGQRFGFRELGRSVQDALLKQKEGDKDEKRNNLLEQGLKKQDEMIKAIKEQENAGALT